MSLRIATDRPKKAKTVDPSFLPEGAPVYIYSGQKLNSAELQKRQMRAEMERQQHEKMWTYSAGYNSGCFPMIEKEPTLQSLLRNSEKDPQDTRDPWRNAKLEERKIARGTDAEEDWQEGAHLGNLGKSGARGKIVRGAFDSSCFGRGGGDILPLRQPALEQTAPEELEADRDTRTLKFTAESDDGPKTKLPFVNEDPMRIVSTVPKDTPNLVDKYYTTILQEPPQKRGIRFETRKVDREVAKKYGKGRPVPNIACAPPSLDVFDEFREEPQTYQTPGTFAASCSRMVAPLCPGVLAAPREKVHTRGCWPPLSARERTADPRFRGPTPLSAR